MNKITLSAATTIVVASLLTTTAALAQTNAPASPAGTPTLQVVTPQEGQTIYGNQVPILFETQNFQVVDYAKYTANQKGQGHIHVWLDDQNPTMESAKKVTTDNTMYTDVPYGDHTLKAELVNNNHTSLTPPIVVTIHFKTAPTTTPTAQTTTSAFDKNTALVILVIVALVIVAAWWYTKDEDETPAAKTTTPKKTTTKKKTTKKKRK